MKYYIVAIQGSDYIGLERPPIAAISVNEHLLEQIAECRDALLELKKKLGKLEYLVFHDYNPSFPEKVSPEIQEMFKERYDNIMDGTSSFEEITKAEHDALDNEILWRVGYCLLHISTDALWWEAVDKYSDTHFSTSELTWGNLGVRDAETKKRVKRKSKVVAIENVATEE